MTRSLIVSLLLFSLRDECLKLLLLDTQGQPSLPALGPGQGESLALAASRLITSLIDQRTSHLEQLYTYGEADQPVRVVYLALVAAAAKVLSAKPLRWVPVAGVMGLPEQEAGILDYGLRRLRYKLEYSAVGFQLLPGEFTLSELQHTYEIILAEQLDKRNFRRRLLHSGIIEATPSMRSGEGRPARLYRYRPDAVAEIKARRLFP